MGGASQIVYGLSNFMLMGAAAAVVSDETFGALSLVYLQVLLWMSIGRGLTGEAFLIRPELLTERSGRVASGALRLTVLFGTVCAGLIASLHLVPALRAGAPMAFAVALPFAMLHDFGRAVHLAMRAPLVALLGDAIWLVTELVLLVVLWSRGDLSMAGIVLAWGAGALAGAAFNLVQARVAPRHGTISSFVDRVGEIVRGLVAAAAVTFTSRNLTYYLIGFVGGLAVLGDLRKALIAYAPLTAIFLGVSASVVPSLARHRQEVGHRITRLAVFSATLAVLWTCMVLVASALGIEIVTRIIGDDEVVLVMLGAALVAQGVATAGVAGLRALARPRQHAVAVAVSLVVMACAGVVLTYALGAAGAAGALLIGNLLEAILLCAMLAQVIRGGGQP